MEDLGGANLKLRLILRRKLFWAIVVYALLLVWSGFYRLTLPAPEFPQNRKSALVNAVSGGELLDRRVRVTYSESNTGTQNGNLPVVLVHGSPGNADTFNGLIQELEGRRVISVDLPGFGYSESKIPDYSIGAHSIYLAQLLGSLGIEEAHLVGFSLGGGVIAHLADRDPSRAASITFISSIGVQEYELFGDYHVNRVVHGLQLGIVLGLTNLVPHFGVYDVGAEAYARNFLDTDQRPLRPILEKLDHPFLIIHGKDDPLVPVEAAREHSRIVPQSRYVELDDDHFFVFLRPGKVEPHLRGFWTEVENGVATKRSDAGRERKASAAEPFSGKIIPAMGVTAMCFFLLIAFIAFINEDLAFVVAGVFAAQGRFGITFALIACVFGIAVALSLWRFAGKKFSRQRSRHAAPFVSPADGTAEALRDRLTKGLFHTVLISRLYGFRWPLYFLTSQTGLSAVRTWAAVMTSSVVAGILIAGISFLLAGVIVGAGIVANGNTTALLASAVLVHASVSVVASLIGK